MYTCGRARVVVHVFHYRWQNNQQCQVFFYYVHLFCRGNSKMKFCHQAEPVHFWEIIVAAGGNHITWLQWLKCRVASGGTEVCYHWVTSSVSTDATCGEPAGIWDTGIQPVNPLISSLSGIILAQYERWMRCCENPTSATPLQQSGD